MHRELLLLGLLRRQHMHGYELHEFINTRLPTCTNLKKPTAYYLLKKMERNGWLTQETQQEGNRPPRQVYRITEAGEAAFQRLLREHLATHTPTMFSDDISLAFLDALPRHEAVTLLAQRRAQMQTTLEHALSAPPHTNSPALVLEHWVHHLRSELAWMDVLLERLSTPETA